MTLAFITLWTLGVVLVALGCWVPAAVAILLAVFAGARHWLERFSEKRVQTIAVHRVYVP